MAPNVLVKFENQWMNPICSHGIAKRGFELFQWLRAKIVARLLSTVAVPFNSYWSTKEIFRWARSHGYTPSNIVPSTSE